MVSDSGRRSFIGWCLGAMGVIAAATASWPLFRYLAPRSGIDAAGKVVIPDLEVPEGGAKFFEFAGSAAVLVRKRGGDLAAFSAVCTHLGCIVQWEKDRQDFLCPCHGGRFSAEGVVTAGPPPRPLKKLALSVADGKITVG